MKNLARFLLSALLLLVAAGPTAAQDEDREDLDFFLTFVPNIQFSPLYAAAPYLAQAGYDLQIQHGDEPVGVDLIAADDLDFGMVSGEQVLMARAAGRPVVSVYEWFQQFPVGVIVPDTTDAETVADLAGLRVGVPGRFGASYSGLIALLAANDMTEDDIRLESIGFAAPDIICAGGVDASAVYINNEPLQVLDRAARGECGAISDAQVIPVSDYADIVSNGIVTNERTIERDPARVAAVVSAFDAGLNDVIQNPARAYLISLDYVDTLPINDTMQTTLETLAEAQDARITEEGPLTGEALAESHTAMLQSLEEAVNDPTLLVQFRVLLASIPLWQGEPTGFSDLESWQVTLETLERLDALVRPLDAEDLPDAFTNTFLPSAES